MVIIPFFYYSLLVAIETFITFVFFVKSFFDK
jgi:hypothetical protein